MNTKNKKQKCDVRNRVRIVTTTGRNAALKNIIIKNDIMVQIYTETHRMIEFKVEKRFECF